MTPERLAEIVNLATHAGPDWVLCEKQKPTGYTELWLVDTAFGIEYLCCPNVHATDANLRFFRDCRHALVDLLAEVQNVQQRWDERRKTIRASEVFKGLEASLLLTNRKLMAVQLVAEALYEVEKRFAGRPAYDVEILTKAVGKLRTALEMP